MKAKGPNGSIVDATQVDFEEITNPWSTFNLADGTTLKIKIALVDVIRLESWDPIDGTPRYQFVAHPIFRTNIPEKLRHTIELSLPTNQEVG